MSDGKLKELDEKIDKLARVLGTGQRNISYVNDYNQGASQETYQEGYDMSNNETFMGQLEDCSYVNNYSKPFNQPHPNLSYRSTNVENPQDQVYPPQHQPFNPRPQGIHFNPSPQGYSYQGQGTQPNRPSFPPQQGNFSRGNNFQQSGNFQGNFPQAQGGSSHDSETKAMLKQIMDGLAKVQYNQAEFQKETQRRLDVMQTEIERVKCQNAQASSSKPTTSFPSKPETDPKAQCNMITLRSGKELHSPQEVIEEVSEPKETSKEEMKELVEIAKPKENFLDGINDKAKKVLFEPPSYEPPLPFPSRLKNQMIEEQRQRFIEIMDTVMVTLPLKEAIDNSPTWTKFFKSMLTKKKEMERSLNHGIESKKDALQIDSSPTVKTLVKQAHPGRFIIPCSLGSFQIEDALCDSGAFVNVISSEMVEELGIKGMKPHLTSLTFGDASSKCPKGIIEDYPLKVGACIVPTDFVVLDMVGSKKRPLILGAPFLTTVGANIDYVKKVVVLKNVDEKVHYAIEPPLGFCGTITNEEATIEQKEPDRVEVAPSLVEDVLEVDKRLVDQSKDVMVEHMGNLEKKSQDVVSVVKKAKLKKKKLEKAQGVPHEPHHSSLTFEALRIIDGKLECKVKARGGGTKPFGKVRIILEPGKTEIDSGIVNKSMVNAFNMKLKDRGPPIQDGSLPSSSI